MFRCSSFQRRMAACAALLFAAAQPAFAADTCSDLLRRHASLGMQERAIESEYPQTVRVYRECSAYVDRSSNAGEALVKLLACAGSQCLIIGMDVCDAVFKEMAAIERAREAIEDQQRAQNC